MKINFKKTLIYALTTSILLGNITPAMAGRDSIGKVTKTQETDKSESLNTTVYAEVGSFFKVSIPKHIILDGTLKQGNYTISAIGDIAGYETLYVTPDKSFALKSNNLNDVTASISQDKTSWKFNEILEESNVLGNGLIDASGISAGSWNGNFNFNIFLDGATTSIKVEAKDKNGNDLEASAFDINGSEKEALLNSLVEEGLINSTDEVDALIEVKSNQFEGIADTTFDVSSIAKEGEKIAILHFNEETNEWEYISTETVDNNGLIKSDFTSYSPVAFVKVNSDGTYDKVGLTSGLYDANGTMLCTWEESGIGTNCSQAGWIIHTKYPTTATVVIPEGTTKIEDNSFGAYATNVTTVIIPKGITYIGSGAFVWCRNLKNINIPEGVNTIANSAFSQCYSLTDITIPKSVTRIDQYAFEGCTGLKNVVFEETSGWYYGYNIGVKNGSILPSEINNSAGAIYQLTSRLYSAYWSR